MEKKDIKSIIILTLMLIIVFISRNSFLSMHKLFPIYPGEGVTEQKLLSDYFPGLEGTPGDTEVYILEGQEVGETILVLGGTHPNEPAGFLTAVLMIENFKMEQGKVIIIPRANHSAFTHNDPQEGHPQKYTIRTANGSRWFRFGSRSTNPIDQWPDPDVYIHQSGQKLSGSETRNLNRAYPGAANTNLTEKIAYGITQLIKEEKPTISIDLHEASPEYPVINAIVAHQRAYELAVLSIMQLQVKGLDYSLELSPQNFHGLSHREWGDYTQTWALLMESANPVQGRLRGRTSAELVTEGHDDCYVQAARLGRLFVDFDQQGHPLEERVGRHLMGIKAIIDTFNQNNFTEGIQITGFISYDNLLNKGLGAFLHSP